MPDMRIAMLVWSVIEPFLDIILIGMLIMACFWLAVYKGSTKRSL